MKVQFLNSVLALALLAGNSAYAGIGEAKVDARVMGRDAAVRYVRDAEGKLVVEKDKDGKIMRADFLEAEAIKQMGGLEGVKKAVLGEEGKAKDTRTSSLQMLTEANAKGVMERVSSGGKAREVFQLGQKGSKFNADSIDLLTVRAIAKDEPSITLINKMITDGESVGLIKAVARLLAVDPASRPLAEKLIENNKQYLSEDMADNVKAGRTGTQGQFIRYKNHLELIRNMAFEFYVSKDAKTSKPTISRKEALERSIVRLKDGRGESITRERVAELANKLLENKCLF